MDGTAAAPVLPIRGTLGRRSGLAQRVVHRLAAALARTQPLVSVDAEGRVPRFRDLLVATARPQAEPGGLVLDRPRTPVDDPLALTANCFLPWCGGTASRLNLAGLTGFQDLRFAARCPTGIRGTPPQTDLLLTGSNGVAGVVTRVTEHLTAPRTKIAEGYEHPLRERPLAIWHDLLAQLRTTPQLFRLLDAVGLAKHAIGLARTFPGHPATLVYLFWEPCDARDHPVFAAHRAEADLLRRLAAPSGVPLLAISTRELWDRWQADPIGTALRDHATALDARYDVAIGA